LLSNFKAPKAFKPAEFSFKNLNFINHVNDPKAVDVLDPFAHSSLRTKFTLRPRKNYPYV